MKSLDVIKNITKLEKDSVSISDDYIRDLFGEHDGDISTPKDYYTIDEIDSILSKTENTKYTTENGIKEFTCKDGYIDNVVIEGETLVNLCRKIKDVEINTDKKLLELYGNDNHARISNGTFTIINISNKTIYFDFKNISNGSHLAKNSITSGSLVVEIPSNGYIKSLYGYFVDGWDSSDVDEFEKSIIILEGDHTDKPISYFEGLKSVGQGDKIDILSYESNKKYPIDTTGHTWKDGYFIDTESGTEVQLEGYSYTVNYIPITKVLDYIVLDNANAHICFYDENKNYIPRRHEFYLEEPIFSIASIPNNTKFIRYTISTKNKLNYELYQSNVDKKQIPTTLRSLPNGVKDTIEKRGNKYVKVQRCGEVTLNGSEDWFRTDVSQNNTIQFAVRKGTDVAYKGDNEIFMYCDKIKGIEEKYWNNDDEFIFINSKDFVVSLRKSKLSSQNVEGFKTWLQSNPITVVYELATPIIIELTNFNPQVFEGNTTLMLNTGTIQGECDFEVTNSKGSEIEVIKYKLSSIDSQISESILALKELGGIL